MQQRLTRAAASLLAAVLLPTAACSLVGGESDAVEVIDEAQPTTRPNEAADAGLAATASLTLTDFEPGWTEVPREADDDTDLAGRAQADIAACTGSTNPDEAMNAQVGEARFETGAFTSPDTDRTVEHDVGLSPTSEIAAAGMAQVEAPDVPGCMQEAFGKYIQEWIDNPPTPDDSLPEGASMGDVTFGRLNVAPVGDQLIAFRVTIPIQFGAMEFSQFIDIVYLRVGRALSYSEFGSFDAPFEVTELDRLVALSAERLSSIGAGV